MEGRLAYGWRSFDADIAAGLVEQRPEYPSKTPDGGMTCPLATHERELLAWQSGDYTNGTVPHGDPLVSFRVSPTYVLSDPRDNFISGAALIDQLLKGLWGKAETHRLGNENSEDALTWNVMRSLQEAGLLHLLTSLFGDLQSDEPDLYLWGRRINESGAEKWGRLAEVRREFEPTHRQQTEPDVVLHQRGQGWIFVEAKFGSPVTTSPDEERMKRWLQLYPTKAPHLFNRDEIKDVPAGEFPEQLLRNIVFADRIAREEEYVHVVLLAREKELTPVDRWLRRCLAEDTRVTFTRFSWEQIYSALPDDSSIAPLQRYLEEKSYSLRQAFNL